MKKQLKPTAAKPKGKSSQPLLTNSTGQPNEGELPLPTPIDLAKLAATLAPSGDPLAAIKRAMQLYIEAVLFLHECQWKGDSLIMSYGGDAQKKAVEKRSRERAFKSLWGEMLELLPSENDDSVRKYLAKYGIRWKSARTVLDHARRVFPRFLEIGASQETKNGKVCYAVSKHLLDIIVTDEKRRRTESKHKSWKTRRAAPRARSPENTGG